MSDDFKDHLSDLNKAFAKAAMNASVLPKFKVPVFRPIVPVVNFSTIASDIGRSFREANDRYVKMFEPVIRPEIGAALRALPLKILEAVGRLASQSWYVSGGMTMPAMQRWGKLIDKQRLDDANEELCQYFESNLKEIETQLLTELPARARILRAAFTAHANGHYALSVPVFLAQADGVCHDRINASPFMRERGKTSPRTASWARDSGSDMLNAFVHPLTELLPIAYNHSERPHGFTGLNRHAVLHGEDSQYDTRVNSLKALSLLLYVADFVRADSAGSDGSDVSSL